MSSVTLSAERSPRFSFYSSTTSPEESEGIFRVVLANDPTFAEEDEQARSSPLGLFREIFKFWPILTRRRSFLTADPSTQHLDTYARMEATQFLLKSLVHSPVSARQAVREQLLSTALPSDILFKALSCYQEGGGEEYLTEAATLISEYGPSAWVFLRDLVASRREEVEYFIHALAFLNGIPIKTRVAALLELTTHQNKDVRYRLFEAASDIGRDAEPVIRALATDEDEEISEAAALRLDHWSAGR